ncbi:thioredoxin family protein [Mesotoga sp.]|uniref:thioredoxin family protein n=1 Tax=Mesotoga sp. TaxID=2053577 RepID=UPI00345E1C5E
MSAAIGPSWKRRNWWQSKDFPSWKFFKINTVENPAVASEYSVFTVPTIVVQTDGREQKGGAGTSLEEIIEFLHEIDETEDSV